MRTTYKFLLLSSVLPIMSCSDEFRTDFGNENGQLPIMFKAVFPTETRATDAGFENGDRMGLFVLDYIDGKPQDIDNEPHASNVRFEFDETDNTCKGVTDLYWTDNNTPADLVAYYPFTTEIQDPRSMEITVAHRQDTGGTETTMGGYEASDFLYAKVAKVMPTSSAINLVYSHALAGIRVTLAAGEGFSATEWSQLEKNVTITNVVTNGTIDLSDGKVITGTGQTGTIIPLVYDQDFRAITIPQTIAAGTKLFAITVNGQGYSFSKDSEMTYISGKMHTFTITVNNKSDGKYDFTLTSEGITPWLDSVDFRDGLMKQYVVVDVPEVGGLENAIKNKGLDPSRIYNLKLRGNLNQNDYRYIRENITSLKAINLFETRNECFVDSGGGHAGIEKDCLPGGGLEGMSTLTHFIFPKYTRVIGGSFFRGTSFIGDVIIPEGVEEIGWGCFIDCNSILGLKLPQTLKVIGGSAFQFSSLQGELQLPEGLEGIGGSAFHECSLTGELQLPSTLKVINEAAFCGCKFTGSLVFPQGIKKVPDLCFSGAGFTGTLTLPEGIEEIGHEAFTGCGFRGELKIPSTVKRIVSRAFNNTMFSSVIFPKDLEVMEEGAFADCSRLQGTLEIPEKLTIIPREAFANCTLLDEIIIPKNVVRINGGAFAECYNLSYVTCFAEEPPTLKTEYMEDNIGRPYYVFNGVPRDNFTIQVPSKSIDLYRNAFEWKEFKRFAAYSNFVCRPSKACALNSIHTEENVVLNADGAWEITHKPDWITVSKTSGTGKTMLSITFNQLAKGAGDREDYVEFTLQGNERFTTRCEVVQKDYQYDENGCITLQTASKGRGINVVFVGDGFDATAIASGEYLTQVNDQMKAFFSIEPYYTYRDYFNVKACFSLSQETGVNTSNTWRNTKFRTYYAPPASCTSGLLECHEPDAVFDYVVQYAGINRNDMWRTLVVMTLNSDEYGSNSMIADSGATIAIIGRSSDPYPMDSRGMVQREACGIAFGKLANERATRIEYISKNDRQTIINNNARGWYMNLSLSGNVHEVWWKDFIFDPQYSDRVDVYEGGLEKTRGCFRSEINSCMNFGIPYFSLAARYDIVKRIMNYAGEEFTEAKFRANDSDKWGDTGTTRSAGDFQKASVSFNNQTKFFKSRKY